MRLSSTWKVKANKLLFLFVLLRFATLAQESTSSYERYKDKIVFFTDLGFNSAPFTILYPFPTGETKAKYKNNYSPALGFGGAYKWFALRVGFTLKSTTRPKSRFGRTDFLDIGTNFQIKKNYFNLDFHYYKGFALMNAYEFVDTLNKLNPNLIYPETKSISMSINAWRFKNKDFNMAAVYGKTGLYKKDIGTWYIKPTVSIHGIGNDTRSILPDELIDTNVTRTRMNSMSAFEFGLVPGYAYVKRYKNWQVCAFAGLGAVVQLKTYVFDDVTRGFLGLTPRYDFRLIGGYSNKKYFSFLTLEMDNKNIRFNDLKFRQSYYTLRLAVGCRIDRN